MNSSSVMRHPAQSLVISCNIVLLIKTTTTYDRDVCAVLRICDMFLQCVKSYLAWPAVDYASETRMQKSHESGDPGSYTVCHVRYSGQTWARNSASAAPVMYGTSRAVQYKGRRTESNTGHLYWTRRTASLASQLHRRKLERMSAGMVRMVRIVIRVIQKMTTQTRQAKINRGIKNNDCIFM